MKPGALFDVFAETASRLPDAPALTFLDVDLQPRTYTFRRLFDEAAALGRSLAKADIDHRLPIGILLPSQEAQTLHYLAALGIGSIPAILTPPNRKLNREYYAETMAAVLRRSRFAAVISDDETLSLETPQLAAASFERRNEVWRASEDSVVTERPDASFLQFSSGTTGMKRGVLVTDEAVLEQLRVYAEALELTEEDVILSWLPLYHDMGFIACLNMPLRFGVHSIMIEPLDWVARPALFLRAADAYRATLSWNPNFAYAFMADRVRDGDVDGLDLSSLRGLVNCSEPVTFDSQQRFQERFRPHGLREDVFVGCYAMAETTFALTHGRVGDGGYLDHTGPAGGVRGGSPYVSVGRPLDGVNLAVCGEDGEELPERAIGELRVLSPFTFSGYYGEPEATAEAFSGPWYRTGDLGYRVGDTFYVAGRRKDVMIVGGVNVFPGDVEELASRVDGVAAGRVSVFSLFDASLETERVVILFEPDETEPRPADEAMIEIRQRVLAAFQLANFETHAVAPGWLVKSSSGKMARGANRSKWAAERSASATSSATGS